jgi:hypothetical protein
MTALIFSMKTIVPARGRESEAALLYSGIWKHVNEPLLGIIGRSTDESAGIRQSPYRANFARMPVIKIVTPKY